MEKPSICMWNTNFNLSRKYCNNIYFKMHISLNLAILFFAIYVTKRVTPVHKEMCSMKLIHVKTWNVSWISMLFMCRGPANLLCIAPILVSTIMGKKNHLKLKNLWSRKKKRKEQKQQGSESFVSIRFVWHGEDM